jgi:hypothetical protein
MYLATSCLMILHNVVFIRPDHAKASRAHRWQA